MNADLLQFLVPIGLFVFWALAKLSERNVKPLENRRSRPAEPDPFGNPVPTAPPVRFNPAPSLQQRMGANDDIIILGSDVRAVPRPAPRRAQPRRPQSPKPAQPKPKPEPKRRPNDVNVGVSQSLKESMAIAPLNIHTAPVSLATSVSNAATVSDATPMSFVVQNIRGALVDPRRVREAIVISEILSPPLALRRKN